MRTPTKIPWLLGRRGDEHGYGWGDRHGWWSAFVLTFVWNNICGGVVIGVVVDPLLEQFPWRWGRQLWHVEPALTQEQFLHRPERLHLQQGMVSYGYTHRHSLSPATNSNLAVWDPENALCTQ